MEILVTKKEDVEKLWFSLNFTHEKVDNKMYLVVCITFGIAKKNYVKIPDSNSYLGL